MALIYDSADRPAPAKNETEVTPEMIEAGVDEMRANYLDLDAGSFEYPRIVRSVFCRMVATRKERD
jgi:hypothetical protein